MAKKDKEKRSKDRSRDLRAEAKARLYKSSGLPPELEKISRDKLIEELRVHQISIRKSKPCFAYSQRWRNFIQQ